MLKFGILALLFVTSIRATLSRQDMTSALISAEDTGALEETFKKCEKEQNEFNLSIALADVATVPAHVPKVAACLGMARDPFPKNEMCVSELVHGTLVGISNKTDTESFTNLITSFKPSDLKPLVSLRYETISRDDAVNVLKNVMVKSPELITHDLPNWIAFHSLDRNSRHYFSSHEETFQYLTSFATQSVLEKALTIVKRNEHYTIAYKDDSTVVGCCKSQSPFPQELFDKINALLELVKTRNARINDTLTLLPKVLVDLVLDYVHVTVSDCSISTPETSVSVLGKRSLPLQSSTLHKRSKRSK